MKKIYAQEGAILITEQTGSNVLSLVDGVEIPVTDKEFEKIQKDPQKYMKTYDTIVKREKEKKIKENEKKQVS